MDERVAIDTERPARELVAGLPTTAISYEGDLFVKLSVRRVSGRYGSFHGDGTVTLAAADVASEAHQELLTLRRGGQLRISITRDP